MNLNRRDALSLGLAGAAVALLPVPAGAAVPEAVRAYTGGAVATPMGIFLSVPEIADNGGAVPVTVEAPGAAEIVVFAPDNPDPKICTYRFGPAAGRQMAATRIRLARSQDVYAVARMPNGRFLQTAAEVRVTVGGCGG